MADVRGTAAFAFVNTVAPRSESRRTAKLAFGQFEAKRTRGWVCLRQFQLEMLADTIGLAAFFPDQRPRRFVIAEIFIPKDRRRDQPVAAQILDRGEEAERLDAGNAAAQDLPDLVGKKGRD